MDNISPTPQAVINKWVNRIDGDYDPEELLRAVVHSTGVTAANIKSRSRNRTIVRARHLWWAAVRHYCRFSYPEIGYMSGVDHTSVLVAVRKVPKEVVTALGDICASRS